MEHAKSTFCVMQLIMINGSYGKCPKISYTKTSDKMVCANNADPDQTAPEGAV